MWVYYSSKMNDMPMIVRSSIELALLSISAMYIVRNKIRKENIVAVSEQKIVSP
jgi:hypothetical protein